MMPPQNPIRRTLFIPFNGMERIGSGAYGHVFRLQDTSLAIKIAHRIVNGTPSEDKDAAESLEILHQERGVYEALIAKPYHPNILQYFLATEVALFLKLEPETLAQRLDRRVENPVSQGRQFLWAKEVARAVSWLESLDLFHCDLRPDNMLLDEAEHIKLCDFGEGRKSGCEVDSHTFPYYRPATRRPIAGPTHEQFAVGSCIDTILVEKMPHGSPHTCPKAKQLYDAFTRGHYLSTDRAGAVGDAISRCWHASYGSMKEVETAIEEGVGTLAEEDSVACLSPEEHAVNMRACREFLGQQNAEYNKVHGE